MNILTKLIELFSPKSKVPSHKSIDNYSSSPKLNQGSIDEIKERLKKIILPCSKITPDVPSDEPINSQFVSHFGGTPYFENGEDWPTSESGRALEFIFQIFNDERLNMAESIKLVQFFYDMEEFPWETEGEGWQVKIYESLNREHVKKIEPPLGLETIGYCNIAYQDCLSLPDWEGMEIFEKDAWKLCAMTDNPWKNYEQAVTEIIGEQNYQSQLGGYPRWVQGEATPKSTDGSNAKLLFQIDSEENVGLMWGDVGLVYVFYDEKSKKIDFRLQCH
jgi:uncharacterized protein YwqG